MCKGSLRINRTNPITRRREDATSRKVGMGGGLEEVAWRRNRLQMQQQGREPWSWRKMRASGAHIGICKRRTITPKLLTGKMRGADFPELLQPAELKD